ncbi:acyl-CoA dehydrogenase family protein [Paraburkholderia nemoris]|uniref:acyl-CoA dehydrogenase family protein n=1 Tax=Paraburkholderia nemoris TaxID=2793076 RepID=UPI0038BA1C38
MIRNTNEIERIISEIRSWVRERCIPNEKRVDDEDAIPSEIEAEMKKMKLFGYSIPEAYGGMGMTMEELALAAIELSYCSPAFRARFGGNTGVSSEGLVQDGTAEQRSRWLPGMASGEVTGCFALTEPDTGSDAASLQTSARRDGDHFILNGVKAFITNAPLADLFTVFARTGPGERADGVTAFLIPRGTPGLTTGEPYKKMGQNGSPVSHVLLNDCLVSTADIIGGEAMLGKGFKTVFKALNKQRIHLAALSVGPAIRLVDEATRYAMSRKQFNRPIADFQLVQALLADCQTDVTAARALVMETARKRDDGLDVTMEASISKYFCTEMLGRVADRAVQIFGGRGYVEDDGIARFYRDVRALRIYEGTSQIHQLNIAKQMLSAAR